MKRVVEPELLDSLPPDDPGAVGSRRDLQLLHAWMGHRHLMARVLRSGLNGEVPRRIVELGAGDGRFMLRLATQSSPRWPGVCVTLLDQQETMAQTTRQAFDVLNWHLESVQADVFDWIRSDDGAATQPRADIMIATLFLHHFDDAQLTELFRGITTRAKFFVALEPRRSRWALMLSQQLWFIGCNRVTRHDAPVSVRAGFRGKELSQLWPADGNWILTERASGLFSQLFMSQLKA